MKSALSRELKENSAYLRDGGFHSTATLIEVAAKEIDWLAVRIAELEHRQNQSSWPNLASISRHSDVVSIKAYLGASRAVRKNVRLGSNATGSVHAENRSMSASLRMRPSCCLAAK